MSVYFYFGYFYNYTTGERRYGTFRGLVHGENAHIAFQNTMKIAQEGTNRLKERDYLVDKDKFYYVIRDFKKVE